MYKTDISTARWILYDIPANIGWISYYIALGRCLAEKPDFMAYGGLTAVILLAVIPALFMLIGLVELISERIHKLNFVLPKVRLYRGFGALALGGITGAVLALIGIVCARTAGAAGITYLYVLFLGGVLCAVFSGLLFAGYKPVKPSESQDAAETA